jgi:hypothetical protein
LNKICSLLLKGHPRAATVHIECILQKTLDILETLEHLLPPDHIFCELCSPHYYIISHNDLDTHCLDLDSKELFVFELLDTH